MKKVILKIKKRFFKSKSPSKNFMRTNIDAYIDAFKEQKGDSKNMTTNMELLAHRVEQWAKERGLDNPDNCERGRFIMSDNVNKPRHYISESGIEALDVIDAFKPCPEYKAGFFWGNVVKYVLRFHKKNGVEDLKKAEFYLKRLIEELDHGSRK